VSAVWAALRAAWVFVALAGLGFQLQSDVVSHLSVWGARPDLVLAAVVLLARRRGPLAGTLAGFFAGLMQDGLTPDRVGLHAALLCSAGYLLGHLRVGMLLETPVTSALILLLAAAAHELLLRLLLADGQWGGAVLSFLTTGLAGALYTAVLVPLLVFAVPRVVRGRA
jgi:rod shape-determining protein MreD